MEKQSCCRSFLQKSKPYLAMMSLQFGYAGMNIISKVSLNGGMSHYVLVVYRQIIATAVIVPFALFFERKARPKITFPIFMQIFVLGLLGPVIDLNFYYAGLKFTSPTFSCAISNMLPAMTFVMAVIFRMEKINLKKVKYQAKLIGTVFTVGGAMVMTLYKGPVVEMLWSKHVHPLKSAAPHQSTATATPDDKSWFKGSIFLIIATLAWASFFILQTVALKTYRKHQLTLTSLVCFVGTLQSIAVTFVMEHKASVWSIGWDMNLLAAAYAGIVASSISYYVQGLVMKTKGPVFATAFSPLMMIIVAVMGSFILAEKIFLGGVLGSLLIVIGLYSVLWGKHKEEKEKEAMEKANAIPEATKGTPASGGAVVLPSIGDIEANGLELQKQEANNNKLPNSVAIALPISDNPTKASQDA
ncbi:WAT1-related protein At5g07050-like [Diospyros lotus]|uniref:WAT1-related protein At5g07050-like n=1 Tax=Diospyros lotus TaxID=55363 RepID=UPI0022507CD1|nr:WAT1-related protein At5g07050-like [Diospyros lotus]